MLSTGVDTTYQSVTQTPGLITEYQSTQPLVQYQIVDAVVEDHL